MPMDPKTIESLRRDFGFVVSTDQDPDLLQYLVNCFLDEFGKEQDQLAALVKTGLVSQAEADLSIKLTVTVLKQFVEHARKTLRANPPISMTYLHHGLGIQLSNHQFLPFVDPEDPKKKEPGKNDTRAKGAVEVTTASQRGGGMRGMVQVPTDVPVTGVEKK